MDVRKRPSPSQTFGSGVQRQKGGDGAIVSGILSRLSELPTSVAVVFASIGAFVFCALMGFFAGWSALSGSAIKDRVPAGHEWTFSQIAELNRALARASENDADQAMEIIAEIEKKAGTLPSLNFARAFVATRTGQDPDQFLKAAVADSTHSSDALAMQAVDDSIGKRAVLEKAILADPMNPLPFVELAAALREDSSGDVVSLLDAAKDRMPPIDVSIGISVTKELVRLASLPDEELPEVDRNVKRPALAFGSAYVAFRRGDQETAGALLAVMKEFLDPETFSYLVADPAFSAFRTCPIIESTLRGAANLGETSAGPKAFAAQP